MALLNTGRPTGLEMAELVLDAERLAEAEAIVREVHTKLTHWADATEAYAADRADKWQESDVGTNYVEWVEKLKELAETAHDLLDQLGTLQADVTSATAGPETV